MDLEIERWLDRIILDIDVWILERDWRQLIISVETIR